MNAKYYAEKLNMQPHPEGGWYKETYRSEGLISQATLPTGFAGDRNFSTGIYFLLEYPQFSAFHRIKSDEMWHFYKGAPLHVFVIHPNGEYEVIKLGDDIEKEQSLQAVVKAGCWFASQPVEGASETYSLVGCTVAPGFDFNDFEMAGKAALIQQYPQHAAIINKYCRLD